jgi:hypothetical protein
MFKTGDRVKLKGKSRHGKNRIHQFGDLFTVVDVRPRIQTTAHRGCIGPFAFLNCDQPHLLEGSRWIAISNDDPDFEIVQ